MCAYVGKINMSNKKQLLNKRTEIEDLTLIEDFIDQKIDKFMFENGTAEETIRRLFEKSDNGDPDNIFCRVACIDLIYSTQIQRFSKNGIATVAEHIHNLKSEIADAVKKNEIDFGIYRKLAKIVFRQTDSKTGEEIDKTRMLYSFASKFLSFIMPEVYPIMDGRVRTILGIPENTPYEEYSKIIIDIQKNYRVVGIDKTLKEWDMFLWQWEKDLDEELSQVYRED